MQEILLFLILVAICFQQMPIESITGTARVQNIRTLALIALIAIGAFFVFVL